MADEKQPTLNTDPVFFRDGKLVNGKGQEVDKNGKVKEAEASASADSDVVAALTQERDDALARVKELEGQALLPADARERLIGVKGMGEKLADEALSALKAPAQAG